MRKLERLQTIGLVSNRTLDWYRSARTQGMYKSDLCRMAQLYLHGGLYLDNDLQLFEGIGLLLRTHSLGTCLDLKGTQVTPAI